VICVTCGENHYRKNIEWQKNEGKRHPGSTIVHLRRMAKNVDGNWRFVVKAPYHNHPASPPEEYPMHRHLDYTGCCCGHYVVRGTGHNSKTCPEHARIMVIKRPVLEEPAMEGASNADPVY